MDMMLLLKASVLLTAALAGARLLRGAPAATRHRLWSAAFAALLALPLLAFVVPALHGRPCRLGRSPWVRRRDMPAANPRRTSACGAADANVLNSGTGGRLSWLSLRRPRATCRAHIARLSWPHWDRFCRVAAGTLPQ